jgi:hypothetical protein
MPENQSSLDPLIEALDARIERLRQLLPEVHQKPETPETPATSLSIVRIILTIFVVAGAGLLINDAVALFYSPDEYVFVSHEGQEFEVWSNVFAFESATGEDWIKQGPGKTQLSATYHNARRNQAVSSVPGHLLFLVLSAEALRKVRQVG